VINVQQDYDLSAVFMRNWDTRDEAGSDRHGCEWEKDWEDVQKVCKQLDIPCQMVGLLSGTSPGIWFISLVD
jgi:tRNA-specific 2-thiouridylase